jgi:hypothetical protein
MDQNGHCRCAEHAKKYNSKNIRPAWYVAPEHLKTILFCGRCAGSGERVRDGLVFGKSSTKNGLVQFTRQSERYGRGRWRKLKGKALVRLADGTVRHAELHWFEAHGIGKRKMRIKRFLD